MSPETDTPTVNDDPGPWDEIVNRAILLLLAAAPAGLVAYLAATGSVSTSIRVTGSIPAWVVAGVVGSFYVALALLALMKFYGVGPVAWVLKRMHNLAKNYNP